MSIQSVRGMRDLFGDDAKLFDYLCHLAGDFAVQYGFESLHLPVLESLSLFVRNLGESTDVVSKEIYSFESRGGEQLALRPEFTAGVSRFFVEHGLYKRPMPQKFFSIGPIFRYDRPQKGRYRQFTQFNFEIFGADGASYESFALFFVAKFLGQFGIRLGQEWKLKVNFLGDENIRESYKKALVAELLKYADSLSEDSRRRLVTNPLRVLDSKDPRDMAILGNIPPISDFYTDEYRRHIEDVLFPFRGDPAVGFDLDFVIDYSLVRGLDYYDGLVFEVCRIESGVAQNAVLGGGKYARLVRDVSDGVANVAAIGFAAGVERLLDICKDNGLAPPVWKRIYIAGWREKMPYIFRLAEVFSGKPGIAVEVALKDYGSSAGYDGAPESLDKKHNKVCGDAVKKGFDAIVSFFGEKPSYRLLSGKSEAWQVLDTRPDIAAEIVSSAVL